MRKWIVALALSVAFALAPAAANHAAAQTYGSTLRVEAGQTYAVTVDVQQVVDVAGQSMDVSASQVYRLDILSSNAGGGVWRYTPVSMSYGDMSAFGMPMELPPEALGALGEGLSALLRIAADIGFECRVDAYGRCLAWSNWPTWSIRIENTVLMIDAFARLGMIVDGASEEFTVTDDGVSEVYEDEFSDDQTESQPSPTKMWLTMREPVLQSIALFLDGISPEAASSAMSSFHPAAAVQGRVMTRGQAENFVEEWTMPFNAPSVRVSGELTLASVNRRDNTGEFVRTATLDSESLRETLRAMADTISNDVLAPVRPTMEEHGAEPDSLMLMFEELLPQIGLEATETTRGTVDLSTGMARQTVTEYKLIVTPPADPDAGQAAQSINVDLVYTLTFTPGAPPAPGLPRP